jgi:hypothetical protein
MRQWCSTGCSHVVPPPPSPLTRRSFAAYTPPYRFFLSLLVMAMIGGRSRALARHWAFRSREWNPVMVPSCPSVLSSQYQLAGLNAN